MQIADRTVFTEQKDFTLSNLREMVDDGDIITNPDYQREYIYDEKRASKLIESILMGIPIPAIYLCQEDDETYTVIDGQQRITSFVKFLKNEFKLKGLTETPELIDKDFKSLDKDIQKKIKSSSLRTICLLKESKALKYEIFARLNQGAVSLKPQELRNCIYRGTFNNMIEGVATTNPLLPKLFHDVNLRKVYQERILRFFALRNFADYKSSMMKTMNEYMQSHQNDDDIVLESKALFNSTIDIIKQVLGEEAFFAYDREKNKVLEKFSGPVYDSIVIPFSFFNKHDVMAHADDIRTAIDNTKRTDEQYKEDTYAATGSKSSVVGRIMRIYTLLSVITGSVGNDDGNRTFSNSLKQKLFTKGYICSYCGNEILSIDDCEIDHILAYSKGGETKEQNAQLLHRYCNRSKNDADLEEWEEEVDFDISINI